MRIDAPAPDPILTTPDDDRSRRSPVAAVGLGALVLLSFILVQFLATSVLLAFDAAPNVAGGVSGADIAGIAFVQVTGIAVIGALVRVGSVTWHRLGAQTPRGPTRTVAWGSLLPVALLVVGPSIAVASVGTPTVLDPAITPTLALAFIGLALLISINEELWFRGLMVDRLQSARRPWLTIVASAVLFGLPHVGPTKAHLLNALAVTLAVGIPFTVVRLRSGSIAPLVGCHLIINGWAFLHTASVTPQGSPDSSDFVATLVLPALVAVGYVWWYRRGMRQTG